MPPLFVTKVYANMAVPLGDFEVPYENTTGFMIGFMLVCIFFGVLILRGCKRDD